ncbi:MAG: hypothetical protein EPO26_06240 [Chloroflexota bacterium]|nr:MAG: hypothetical protein EPO26_06240 [Chloroflexota bacterium]
MNWIKRIGGALLALVGLVWIGQGLNILPGSMMSGQPIYAILGLIILALGLWLLWIGGRRARK